MSSLFSALSVALSGLMAQQGALEVTSNNVANANTPGFSRQRPILLSGDPIMEGPVTVGTGVVLSGIESLRDPILELRLNQETQQQGYFDTTVAAMQQVEVMFNGSSNDIGQRISQFFSTLNQLSADPSSLAQRQAVLTAAQNVATSFRDTANQLQSQRTSLDLGVQQTVDQINVLTEQIAKVNQQISGLENLHQNAGAFVDQRNSLIRQLANLVDVAVVQTESGITLTTAAGNVLVAGTRSFQVESQLDTSGVQHIFSQDQDITARLTSGKLAGLIVVRDQQIPTVLSNLDTLASGFSSAINQAHRQGVDLEGDPGADLFSPPPTGPGAAASMSVLIADPEGIAAASTADPSSGNNANLTALLAVQNQAVANGQAPIDFYSNLIFRIGSVVSNGSAEQEASSQVLLQLEDQRSGVSGVSMDEEAANMIRYQRAFEAAARVITTISDMTETIIQLGRY